MNKLYKGSQLFWLVALRVAIGWHFLFEGLVKLSNPEWSSYFYLMDSKGIFQSFFKMMAENEQTLQIVNYFNIWGLIIIGLFLILGLFSKQVIIAGITLLSLYYLSHPPFFGMDYILPDTGSYWIVDKTLIEILALAVLLVFPTGREVGLDRMILKKKRK